jgi:predicted nucleic acid-binding protein
VDTNIILHFFLEREPFFQDASTLFEAIASSQLEGFITASSATDIFYISKKQTQNLEEEVQRRTEEEQRRVEERNK